MRRVIFEWFLSFCLSCSFRSFGGPGDKCTACWHVLCCFRLQAGSASSVALGVHNNACRSGGKVGSGKFLGARNAMDFSFWRDMQSGDAWLDAQMCVPPLFADVECCLVSA